MYNIRMKLINNINFIKEIEAFYLQKLPIRLGVNKMNELIRLSYEICTFAGAHLEELADSIALESIIKDGKGELFHRVKHALLELRYPSKTSSDDPHIMPVKISASREECTVWDNEISPSKIFVEKDVRNLKWTDKFLTNFPNAEVIPVERTSSALNILSSGNEADLYNVRRDNVIINRNKAAFTKPCPCTKDCLRCGYWILNVGFGCPIDCTYCYLQMYSNSPGIILPANIEEYAEYVKELNRKVSSRIRIGTGEFTDSLALDKYTEYSKYLIPMFRDTKNLVLELKTKVSDISNVLECGAHENLVVSWSINTRAVAQKYEKGAADVKSRIASAEEAAGRGFKVAFHFDPVVHYEGWEQEYKDIIGELFSSRSVRENTSWISLGTLRYTPGLKQAAENRFADNQIFYGGEFFSGFDDKLRYTRALRVDIYKKMADWISSCGVNAWIYLCMEPIEVWDEVGISKKEF